MALTRLWYMSFYQVSQRAVLGERGGTHIHPYLWVLLSSASALRKWPLSFWYLWLMPSSCDSPTVPENRHLNQTSLFPLQKRNWQVHLLFLCPRRYLVSNVWKCVCDSCWVCFRCGSEWMWVLDQMCTQSSISVSFHMLVGSVLK